MSTSGRQAAGGARLDAGLPAASSGVRYPPWVPPGRETDALDAVRAAASRYVNQDGQVVLDWKVTLLEAQVDEASGRHGTS